MYDRRGQVLLLGVGHVRNTSLHLAECRAALDLPAGRATVPVTEDGEVIRVEYTTVGTDTSDFAALGADFEAEVGLEERSVGAATAKLVDQRTLVGFAVEWLEATR